MKTLTLIITTLFCAASVQAVEILNAPDTITKENYLEWISTVTDSESPFYDFVFAWRDREKDIGLPEEVFKDKENIFIRTDRVLEETIKKENANEIEAGNTYGMEVYAVLAADIDVALNAFVFRAGKPIGQEEGETYPLDSVFSYRKEEIRLQWGPRSYLNRTTKTRGGFVQDMHDLSAVLVRGNREVGYEVWVQHIGEFDETSSKSNFFVLIFRPMAGGRSTAFKSAGFYQGQSYRWPDLSFGRRQFGFNQDRIRSGQKEYFAMVDELRDTGAIRQRTPSQNSEQVVPNP